MKRSKKKDLAEDSLSKRALITLRVFAVSLGLVLLLLLAWLLLREIGVVPTSSTVTIKSIENKDGLRQLRVSDEDGEEFGLRVSENASFTRKPRGKPPEHVRAKELSEGMKLQVSYHAFGSPPYTIRSVQVVRR